MKPVYQFFASHPTLYAVAESMYWGLIIALVLYMFWRSGRSEAASQAVQRRRSRCRLAK